MAIKSDRKVVTIDASGNGEAHFQGLNGLVGYVFISPEGTPSTVNAELTQEIEEFAHVHKASAVVSTTLLTVAYSLTLDTVVIMVTENTPLVVQFTGGTANDEFVVTVLVEDYP